MDIGLLQKNVCDDYRANFTPVHSHMKIGISRNINTNILPIHGLRHPAQSGTSGWYIWRGPLTAEEDFFDAVCLEHMPVLHPDIRKYLALPPGWRFLVGPEHEDVWLDSELLNIF